MKLVLVCSVSSARRGLRERARRAVAASGARPSDGARACGIVSARARAALAHLSLSLFRAVVARARAGELADGAAHVDDR